jgi:trimethylamine--corrinoid protein Co-methyltransferase
MARYENAFYQPLVSDWQNHENWVLAGGLDTTQRATQLWQSVLANYQLPMLDPVCGEALDDYVAKRKNEIGNNDLD